MAAANQVERRDTEESLGLNQNHSLLLLPSLRLPYRKIQNLLKRIRSAPILHVDETGIRSVVHISFICNLSCFFGFSTPSKMSYNGIGVKEVWRSRIWPECSVAVCPLLGDSTSKKYYLDSIKLTSSSLRVLNISPLSLSSLYGLEIFPSKNN